MKVNKPKFKIGDIVIVHSYNNIEAIIKSYYYDSEYGKWVYLTNHNLYGYEDEFEKKN